VLPAESNYYVIIVQITATKKALVTAAKEIHCSVYFSLIISH